MEAPKKGRPVSDNPRAEKVETRMSKDELDKLEYCCEVTGMTKSEAIRAGINLIYTHLKKQHEPKIDVNPTESPEETINPET